MLVPANNDSFYEWCSQYLDYKHITKREEKMELKDSKTAQNLKDAFSGESQANRRYLYFAQKADIEGAPDVASVFRSTGEGETGHAHGHLEYLEEVGDATGGTNG